MGGSDHERREAVLVEAQLRSRRRARGRAARRGASGCGSFATGCEHPAVEIALTFPPETQLPSSAERATLYPGMLTGSSSLKAAV